MTNPTPTAANAPKATPKTTLDGARGVALETLRAVDAREAFLQPALEAAVRKAELDGRDRGLALELTSGVLRWQRRLDHRIAPFLRRGLEETDPGLLRILRLAVYQLDYMDRVPARAAVHEAVQQARITSGEGGSRLVNAVLRAVTQIKESLPTGDAPEALGVRLSHPDWLAARVIALLGVDDATALLAAHNRPAPLTIRACVAAEALLARLADEGGQVVAGRFGPTAYHLDHPAPFASLSFHDGLWTVQDEAAQLVAHLVDPQPGERVWDVCAAPGGKTRHLLSLMGQRGALHATDRHSGKVRRLAELLVGDAAAAATLTTAVHDASEAPEAGRQFDRVLLDAPCSGLGTLRRHPEIRWRRTPESVAVLAAEQRRMLTQCAKAVRPGGVFVYSVCTFTHEEGPDAVVEFLSENSDFALETPPDGTIDWAALAVPLGAGVGYRTWPHRHDMDGFFAARMRRLR